MNNKNNLIEDFPLMDVWHDGFMWHVAWTQDRSFHIRGSRLDKIAIELQKIIHDNLKISNKSTEEQKGELISIADEIVKRVEYTPVPSNKYDGLGFTHCSICNEDTSGFDLTSKKHSNDCPIKRYNNIRKLILDSE